MTEVTSGGANLVRRRHARDSVFRMQLSAPIFDLRIADRLPPFFEELSRTAQRSNRRRFRGDEMKGLSPTT